MVDRYCDYIRAIRTTTEFEPYEHLWLTPLNYVAPVSEPMKVTPEMAARFLGYEDVPDYVVEESK